MRGTTRMFTMLLAFYATSNVLNSQTALFSWAGSYEGGTNTSAEITDLFWKSPGVGGDLLNTGYFSGTIDLDMSTGNAPLTSNGLKDIFVSRQSDNGAYAWAVAIGGTGDDEAWCIADSPDGNLIIAGSFSGTVDFDPGPGTSLLTSTGGTDGFILKLNRMTGAFMWAVNAASGPGNEIIKGITFLTDSSIVATGNFESTADFDPGIGTAGLISAGMTDVFVTILSPTGIYVNSASFEGPNVDSAFCVVSNSNNEIFVNGHFTGTIDTDPGAGSNVLTSVHTGDMFIVKLTSSLTFGVGRMLATTSHVEMAIDVSSFRILLAGSFQDSIDMNMGTAVQWAVTETSGQYDVFVASYFGSLQNAISLNVMGGSGDDHVSAINNYYNFVILGGYTLSPSFEWSVNAQDTIVLPCTGNDLFVVAFDFLNGVPWNSGTVPNSSSLRTIKAVDTKADLCIFAGGGFNSNPDFNPTAATFSLTAAGTDAWLTKWDPCGPTYTSASFGVCDTIFWLNNIAYPVPCQVYDTLQSMCGADSVVQLNVQLALIDTGVTASGFTLTSEHNGGIYQWVDCNNNFAAISGATSQSFTPTIDGSYAVIVDNTLCQDTSACFPIIGIGISENVNIPVTVSPNPFTDHIIIRNPGAGSWIELKDMTGKTLYSGVTSGSTQVINGNELSAGVYFIHVSSKTTTTVLKVVKY